MTLGSSLSALPEGAAVWYNERSRFSDTLGGRAAPRKGSGQEMKTGIHPKYQKATVHCACGTTWETMSTLPEIRTEICSACHPFYTGKQKIVDTEGRVEKFYQRYGMKQGK
jgi:large subunit ribosomal protein L31